MQKSQIWLELEIKNQKVDIGDWKGRRKLSKFLIDISLTSDITNMSIFVWRNDLRKHSVNLLADSSL